LQERVRFDDRLHTVLAQPAGNAHDRAVRWRQLVELLARAHDLSSDTAQQALVDIRGDSASVDEQLRAAAARAIARPQLPPELVSVFAADSITVAAPVLAAASLESSEWESVLITASPESLRFIRALHPALPESEPPAPKKTRKRDEQPEEPAAQPMPSISDVLARIERLRQDRQQMPERPPARRKASRPGETSPSLFRWECGPSGEIAWVDGVPRGALIGRSLANPGEHNGVDARIQRAFALRAPFREAKLVLHGTGIASGEWKLNGMPAFEPGDGRFAGYRGVALRAAEPEEVAPVRAPLDDDTLRELVHELKTPLNAIIGFAEIIDGQYLGPADFSYRERAAEIVGQARLLLSAIEDLDIAAQLRSASESGDSRSDLNEVLASLDEELRERASHRGISLNLTTSATASEVSVSQAVLERLIRRFASAMIDAALPRETISIAANCDVGQCIIGASRPQSLREMSEQQLFGRDDDAADALATSFSLKLARGIAQTVGGDLRLQSDRFALILPRNRS
jgi:His Kinase A (phospho-acceptor) domain